MISGEREAIQKVLAAGENYGYGNMIAYLKQAWAENLMNEYDFDVDTALSAADTSAYTPNPMNKAKAHNKITQDNNGE